MTYATYAIQIEGQENIGFPPEDVYRVGIQAETWPDISGLALHPTAEELAIGGLIKVGLRIPGGKYQYWSGR